MVISGLWHGAAWTFVIWGALHAVGRLFTRELEKNRQLPQSVLENKRSRRSYLAVLTRRKKLEKRAERAEKYADDCIEVASFSAAEAQVAILEAVAARRDADDAPL